MQLQLTDICLQYNVHTNKINGEKITSINYFPENWLMI